MLTGKIRGDMLTILIPQAAARVAEEARVGAAVREEALLVAASGVKVRPEAEAGGLAVVRAHLARVVAAHGVFGA